MSSGVEGVSTRATLGRVIDDLGETLLETLAGTVRPSRPISGVVIHDPLDVITPPTDTLLLGVGLADPLELATLLRAPGTAAVVVRLPLEVDSALRAAADESDAVLLGLTRGASWAQVAALLRSMLAVDDVGGGASDSLAGLPAGDLFAVANAIASLIAAPITIEDRSSRVLAFSGDHHDADSGRIATILGRQVPEHFRRSLEEQGIFRRLYADDEPLFLASIPGTELSRAAVRVRAGDEILGSIWAAVDGPLSAERSQAMVEASKLVALHLLRARAGADVERRLRSDLVATLLEGGPGAGEAASRLGVSATPLCVLALATRPEAPLADSGHDSPAAELDFQRIAAAFAMHLTAVHPKSAVAPVGGVVYGLLPVSSTGDDLLPSRALAIATEFVDRLDRKASAVVGIGRVVTDRTALPRSRHDADRALRVLRDGATPLRVARATDVHVEAMLLELGDLMERDGSGVTGPVARLLAYDRDHSSDMVETLRAWLDSFGDVNAAATAVHVHPNTFRYRLRRLSEVGEIDLGDPDARFAAMLQLRLQR
ncbi:MAG: helix-turn-helix domain-containing protein [Nocardioides sp.]